MVDLAVIMSVYHKDRLSFVKESVQSILGQTFQNFHYYLIFDGPVAQDVDEYITTLDDERIRLYRLEKNGGLAGALNYLLEIVLRNPDYKFIARMDADDISMPTRFEVQRNYLIDNEDITVLGSWYEEIDEKGKHLAYRELPTDHESLRKRYYTRTPFAHSSVMYRRELIETIGYYPTDTILMEDNVLWGRALFVGLRLANSSETLHKFRIDKDFYNRRSGLRYGWSFIKSKSEIGRMNGIQWYYFIVIFFSGFVKMLPVILVEILYLWFLRTRLWRSKL
jgi:glycosyltransferase involved in cell wall biosynthesis